MLQRNGLRMCWSQVLSSFTSSLLDNVVSSINSNRERPSFRPGDRKSLVQLVLSQAYRTDILQTTCTALPVTFMGDMELAMTMTIERPVVTSLHASDQKIRYIIHKTHGRPPHAVPRLPRPQKKHSRRQLFSSLCFRTRHDN